MTTTSHETCRISLKEFDNISEKSLAVLYNAIRSNLYIIYTTLLHTCICFYKPWPRGLCVRYTPAACEEFISQITCIVGGNLHQLDMVYMIYAMS